MSLVVKKRVYLLTLISVANLHYSIAFSPNSLPLVEKRLLRIIDEEVLRMSPSPENMEWTENAGIQPTDAYEMDYSEKCWFIRDTNNKKALTACKIILE